MSETVSKRTRKKKPILDKFFEKIEITDSCWIWHGARSEEGYGLFTAHDGGGNAHRTSYVIFIGEIPDGYQIDHLCRNRSCVNPDHLEPVTPKTNIRRSVPFRDFSHVGNHQRAKTHCPKGHEYKEGNFRTYLRTGTGKPFKVCIACSREYARISNAKRKSSV